MSLFQDFQKKDKHCECEKTHYSTNYSEDHIHNDFRSDINNRMEHTQNLKPNEQLYYYHYLFRECKNKNCECKSIEYHLAPMKTVKKSINNRIEGILTPWFFS